MGRTHGENTWGGHMGRTHGEDTWGGHMGRTHGENSMSKLDHDAKKGGKYIYGITHLPQIWQPGSG